MLLKTDYMELNNKGMEPVFIGLHKSGVTGRGIAQALKVSPALVSKWRRRKSIMPEEVQIFLTLMLADQVERLKDLYSCWGPASAAWHLTARAELDLAGEYLAEQENRNLSISSTAVLVGTRIFRIWWNADRIVNELTVKPTTSVRDAALVI